MNVELAEIYTRLNQSIRIQPECRCSNKFARNEGQNSIYCLENGVATGMAVQKTSRLNEFAHSIDFLNDGNFQTSWISCILTLNNPIIMEIDLANGVYLLQRMEIFFSSLPPTYLTVERYHKNKWMFLQSYSIDCDGSNMTCIQLPKDFSQSSLNGYTIVWSVNTDSEEAFLSNTTLIESVKASKIRLTLIGYYLSSQKDIRQLYYKIDEIRIKGRYIP